MKTFTATLFLLAPFCSQGQTQPSSSNLSPTVSSTSTPAQVPPTQVAPTASVPLMPEEPKVTVTSRGNDIRMVLTDIFAQAKKSLILQSSIHYNLYLSLQDTDFQKSVQAICDQAGLKFDIRDGIYHIYQKKIVSDASPTSSATAQTSALTATPTPSQPLATRAARTPATGASRAAFTANAPSPNADPLPTATGAGKLPLGVLRKKVTTRLSKAPIGAVLEELGTQAGVKIELGENVPAYRLDAVLTKTTLRYALEQVTRAAKLTYTFTDHHTILVDSRS